MGMVERQLAFISACCRRGAKWTGKRITRGRFEGHHEDFTFEDNWLESSSGAKCMDHPYRGTVEWEYTLTRPSHEIHAAAPCQERHWRRCVPAMPPTFRSCLHSARIARKIYDEICAWEWGNFHEATYGIVDGQKENQKIRRPPISRQLALQLVNDILHRAKLGATMPWSTLTVSKQPPQIIEKRRLLSNDRS